MYFVKQIYLKSAIHLKNFLYINTNKCYTNYATQTEYLELKGFYSFFENNCDFFRHNHFKRFGKIANPMK